MATNLQNIASSINYQLLAGPYYKIFVNGNKVSIPEWLAKQVKSVEITEVDAHSSEGVDSVDMAVITIIDAYENVTDASNNLVNSHTTSGKPGNLLDLVITGQNQIHTLTQQELNTRKQIYIQSQNNIDQTNDSVLVQSKFLFQEGNTIDIEWGYNTTPHLKRKMRFVVQYIEYDAPESSSPEAKIYCTPSIKANLGKLRPTVGLTFQNKVKTSDGNTTNGDIFAGDIVKTIADSCGYASIISKMSGRINASDIKPTEFTKTITPNDTIYSYLSKLARDIGFHFFTSYSFKTGRDTIFFLSDEDYSTYSIFNFVWKGPNTLLTRYKIQADFSRLNQGATSSINSNNDSVEVTPQIQANLTYDLAKGTDVTKSQIVTQIPVNIQTGLKNVFKQGVTGVSLYVPIDDVNAQKTQLDQHLQHSESAIIISGSLVGYPYVAPCVATFSNIGKRYSGRYRLINVKHTIDNNAYTIQFTASTNVIADSLVESDKEKGAQDPPVVNDIIKLTTGQLVGTTTQQDSTTLADSFNTQFEMPGKVNYTNSSGSNNGTTQ